MSKYVISSEKSLASSYYELIQPFWREKVQQDQFAGLANITIAYAYVLHPKAIGSIVISSGRIECFIKYKEVVYDLYQNGYSVFIHDHRGQGLSGRMSDNNQMGLVDSFADYVSDFETFIERVVVPNSLTKPLLLCHSMGSAIGTQLILTNPTMFQKVVMSAPMFGIKPALPHWFTQFLLGIHGAISSTEKYFFGQKNYDNAPFVNNELTHSEIRYQLFRDEYEQNPLVQLGGVTGKWLYAAAKAMNEIEQEAVNFPIPALVMQAGSDQIVDNRRQARVASKMPHTQFELITGAKHELLAESDQFRIPCLNKMLNFFSE